MDEYRLGTEDRPRVVALVSRVEEMVVAARVAEGAGAHLAGALVIDAALAATPLEQTADAWLVCGTEPNLAGPLSIILDTLNAHARMTGVPVMAHVAPELLDLAWARLSERAATLQCEASLPEQVAALAVALQPVGSPFSVRDSRTERDVSQLRKLSDDVERIARVLAALTAEQEMEADQLPVAEAPPGPPIEADSALRLIRAAVRARRLRERFFPADLFADPAWDMLLDLMAARLERKRVAVSSLCIAAAVPATTALRYLKTMTASGLFVRRPDATDGRRVFIELSDAAADGMSRYLGQLQEVMAPALG